MGAIPHLREAVHDLTMIAISVGFVAVVLALIAIRDVLRELSNALWNIADAYRGDDNEPRRRSSNEPPPLLSK